MMVHPDTLTRSLPLKVDRKFIISHFVASHSCLILRSMKRNEDDVRIDLLFAGVGGLKLCRRLPTLAVRHATDRETEEVERDMDLRLTGPPFFNLYMIEGGPSPGYVVASGMWMSTDREPDTSPSPLLGNWEWGPVVRAEGPTVQFI